MSERAPHDPRPSFTRTLDQVEALMTAVTPDQLSLPTPCTDFDVRALLGHLVAVLRRIAHVATGGAAVDIPLEVEPIPDDGWAGAWVRERRRVEQAWWDDAMLARTVRAPWGEVPGANALAGYTQELITHSWDLAAALHRTEALDEELGEQALRMARRFIPAEGRGGRAPFGEVVEVPDDAPVYDRLAGWLGRTAPGAGTHHG
jgi:uncharacterized protein (TIGR03086 family)